MVFIGGTAVRCWAIDSPDGVLLSLALPEKANLVDMFRSIFTVGGLLTGAGYRSRFLV